MVSAQPKDKAPSPPLSLQQIEREILETLSLRTK